MTFNKCLLATLLIVLITASYLRFYYPRSLLSKHVEQSNTCNSKTKLNQTKFIWNKTTPHSIKSSKNDTNKIKIEDLNFVGVKVRIYRNTFESVNPLGVPGLIFYHGGGWVLGSPKEYEHIMLEIARKFDIFIVSVDYIKSPAGFFPAPFVDCLNVSKYFLVNSKKYGVNPKRIGIFGSSAGGNLAAAVALKLRDEHFTPMPKFQILICPCLQAHDFYLPSYIQNENNGLSKQSVAYYWSMYASGTDKYTNVFMKNEHTTPSVKKRNYKSTLHHEDLGKEYLYQPYKKPILNFGNVSIWNNVRGILTNPYFAPLMAPNLKSSVPAFVYTAQLDVLRDDSLLYVKRLSEARVEVTHVLGEKATHGIILSFMESMEGRRCMDSIIKYIADNI